MLGLVNWDLTIVLRAFSSRSKVISWELRSIEIVGVCIVHILLVLMVGCWILLLVELVDAMGLRFPDVSIVERTLSWIHGLRLASKTIRRLWRRHEVWIAVVLMIHERSWILILIIWIKWM